jgi:hypothetical protein
MSAKFNRYGSRVGKIFRGYYKTFSVLFDVGDKLNNSLASQVKGITEATASIVAGQMNAIRINQSTYIG